MPEEGIFLPGSGGLIFLVPTEWLPAVFWRPTGFHPSELAHTPKGDSPLTSLFP